MKHLALILMLILTGCSVEEAQVSRPHSAKTFGRGFKLLDEFLKGVIEAINGGKRVDWHDVLDKNRWKNLDWHDRTKINEALDNIIKINKGNLVKLEDEIVSFNRKINSPHLENLIKSKKYTEYKNELAKLDEQYEEISIYIKDGYMELRSFKDRLVNQGMQKNNNYLIEKARGEVNDQIEVLKKLEIDLKIANADLADKKIPVLKHVIDNFRVKNKKIIEKIKHHDIDEISRKHNIEEIRKLKDKNKKLTEKEEALLSHYDLNVKIERFEDSHEKIVDSRNKLFDIDDVSLNDEQYNKIYIENSKKIEERGEKLKYIDTEIESTKLIINEAANFRVKIKSFIRGKVPSEVKDYLNVRKNYSAPQNSNSINDYADTLHPLLDDIFKVANKEDMSMEDIVKKLNKTGGKRGYGTNIERKGTVYQIRPKAPGNGKGGGTTRGYLCRVGETLVLLSIGVNTKNGSSTENKAIGTAATTCKDLKKSSLRTI